MRRTVIALLVSTIIIAVGTLVGVRRYTQASSVTAYDADVNHNGMVNILDLSAAASFYHQPAPLPTATPTAYCNLSGRVFEHANLPFNAGSGSADFSDCRFVGTHMAFAYLASSSFQRADFSGADLSQSYLAGTNFTDANLTGANLTLENAPNVRFIGANLTNAVLSPMYPTSGSPGEDFHGADFTGAITIGADITNMSWSNATCPDGTNSDSDGGTCVGHGF